MGRYSKPINTVKEKTVIEEPKIEEPKIEEPKIEEPKIEEPKIEEPKIEEPNPLIGKKIGSTVILDVSKIEIRGKEYMKLKLSDNTETILSERDLLEQGVK
jgi:hypothetical protein